MWKKGNPNKDGWYLTRRVIGEVYPEPSYSTFWWDTDLNHWCYVKPCEFLDTNPEDASEYVEEWMIIPE